MTAPEPPRLDLTHMADALATVECGECVYDQYDDGSSHLVDTCLSACTGRVPASLPLRVVVDEPLTVECPECKGRGAWYGMVDTAPLVRETPCGACTAGRVPLTEDVTVELVVEQCRHPRWAEWESYDSYRHASGAVSLGRSMKCLTSHERRTVVVGTAHDGRLLEEHRHPVGGVGTVWHPCALTNPTGERRWVYEFPRWTPEVTP